jgi:hypothetical protein
MQLPPPPAPPAQKYLSHNLNNNHNEASSSSSGQKRKQADRPEKGKGRKDNKRKADVLSENDGEYDEYGYNSKNQGGEYLPWVTDVEWFNEDMGGPASVWKL